MNRREYRTSILNWRTGIVALITAVLSFGAAIVTLVVPLIHDVTDREGAIAEREKKIDVMAQELDMVNAHLETQEETIDALWDENAELRAALPYTVQPEDVHDIRSTATVRLAKNGDTLDLNSTLPNFRADGYVWEDTLSYDGDELVVSPSTSSRVLETGKADYSSCAATTGWMKTSKLEPHLLEVPATCLRLASERFAAIQVSRYDENSADVILTVWE